MGPVGMAGPNEFMAICGTDSVNFDPGVQRHFGGLKALAEYYEIIRGKVHSDRFELMHPLVEETGNTVVPTFNYATYAELPMQLLRCDAKEVMVCLI